MNTKPIIHFGPPDRGPLFALRLLCEAWLASQGKKSATLNSLRICAPIEREAWFTPFGKLASKSGACAIAEQMLGSEDAARTFLEAVAKLPKGGTVSWASYEGDVRGLLEKLELALR